MSADVLRFPGRVPRPSVRFKTSPLRAWRFAEPHLRGRREVLRRLANLSVLGVQHWPRAVTGDPAAAIAAAYEIARDPVRCETRIDLVMSALWCAAALDPAARSAFIALRRRAGAPS